MKYLKKYNESKLNTYDSMDNEDLEELLHWSRIEYNELGEKIRQMSDILRGRKENEEEVHSKSLPASIFDFNKEQCDWIFEHHHGTTSKKYQISNKYFEQLKGLLSFGFNPDTNQFQFTLCGYYLEDHTDLNPIKKSIEFIGDNLKRGNYSIKRDKTIECVKFNIKYANSEDYDNKFYYVSENEIYFNDGYSTKKFDHGNDGIKGLLEYIKSRDSE